MWISCFLSALGAILSFKYIDNKQLNSSTNDLPATGSFDDAIVSFIAGGYRPSREEALRHSDHDGVREESSKINFKTNTNSKEKSRASEIAMEGNPISASREGTFAL